MTVAAAWLLVLPLISKVSLLAAVLLLAFRSCMTDVSVVRLGV